MIVVTTCPPPSGTRVSWHRVWGNLSFRLSGLSDGLSVLQMSTLVFKFLSGSWSGRSERGTPRGSWTCREGRRPGHISSVSGGHEFLG